jgi:hypothetical protein
MAAVTKNRTYMCMVKLQVLGNNSRTVNNIKNLTWGKNDQHSKIYLPCNFSEEKIFENVYDIRRTDDERQVMAIAHMTLWVR